MEINPDLGLGPPYPEHEVVAGYGRFEEIFCGIFGTKGVVLEFEYSRRTGLVTDVALYPHLRLLERALQDSLVGMPVSDLLVISECTANDPQLRLPPEVLTAYRSFIQVPVGEALIKALPYMSPALPVPDLGDVLPEAHQVVRQLAPGTSGDAAILSPRNHDGVANRGTVDNRCTLPRPTTKL